MPKKKSPTPQEIYLARKKREEEEREALLPPGFINHGNTCFMNSVLQGLLATKPLHDLVLDVKSMPSTVTHALRLDPLRSPQLSNGALPQSEREMMPLGNVFLHLLQRAWDTQSNQRRESISPKSVLAAIGRKHDQYLDFAQQDAHEFLRQLLDAMRMEEIDVIKKRRPSAPPITTHHKHRSRSHHRNDDDRDDKSFVDMLFGGQLASILVCQKCKHVSITHEDFNDLSLSIKPDEYRDRNKDRLKSITKLFVKKSGGGGGGGNPSLGRISAAAVLAEMPRPSSVPPPAPAAVVKEPEGDKDAGEEGRRNSWEGPVDDSSTPTIATVQLATNEPPKAREREHKDAKSRIDDEWAKLGRRISFLGSGLGKDRKSRANSRAGSRTASPAPPASRRSLEVMPEVPFSAPPTVTSFPHPLSTPTPLSLPEASATSLAMPPPPPPPRSRSPSPRPDGKTRSKSPKPPKPSAAEMEYVKEILADIRVPNSNPFGSIFRPPSNELSDPTPLSGDSSSSSSRGWLKVSQGTTVEECLRMFTNVEVLEGDNMVGCRRCWKIEHGLYSGGDSSSKLPKINGKDEDSADEEEDQEMGKEEEQGQKADSFDPNSLNVNTRALRIRTSLRPTSQQGGPPPLSVSTPVLTSYRQKYSSQSGEISSDDASVSSLPIASEVDIVVVPAISTTAPPEELSDEQERERKEIVAPLPSQFSRDSLHAPPMRYGPMDESSGDESDGSSASAGTASSVDVSHPPPGLSTPSASSTPRMSSTNGTVALPNKSKKEKPTVRCPAYKRYLISTPPPVLVVHLKRFQQTTKTPILSFSHGFKKIDDYVAFQEYLDLTPFLVPRKEDYGLSKRFGKGEKKRERCMYRLYAVVVHLGNMLGGHYIAYTALPPSHPQPPATPNLEKTPTPATFNPLAEKEKSPTTEKEQPRRWAYVSDTVVRLATLEEVLKSKAYICMYERLPSL